MVGVAGLEPATSASQTQRATNCATPRLASQVYPASLQTSRDIADGCQRAALFGRLNGLFRLAAEKCGSRQDGRVAAFFDRLIPLLPEHPIIIEPARTAKWEHAVRAFNAAALARYTNVQFAKPAE